METVQSYKCPSCGSPLSYNGESQNMHCNSCGNNFSVETLKQLDDAESLAQASSKYDWQHYEARTYEDNSQIDLSNYTCPSCGAQITGDSTLGSTVCPYCGNSAVIKEQFSGTLRPDCMIPFKTDKKSAIEAFENDFKNAPFLPDEFKNKKRIEEMAGVYVPYWLFDCSCNANITYSAQTVTAWSDSKYNYTKTDYYRLLRSGSIGFSNLPADGSKKADDTYTEAVEPFDYNDAVEFNPAYLSGFLADKYDVSADECSIRANERVKNSTVSAFSRTTDGYSSVIPENTSINFTDSKVRYVLLPVWMLNIKYKGENYHFAINGQTKKVVGSYPIDKSKKWKYFAKIAGIWYVISALVAWFLLS